MTSHEKLRGNYLIVTLICFFRLFVHAEFNDPQGGNTFTIQTKQEGVVNEMLDAKTVETLKSTAPVLKQHSAQIGRRF